MMTPQNTPAKPKPARGPPRAKAPACLTSSIPRAPIAKREITQLVMTVDQIVAATQLSEPKDFNGTACRFLNGPQGQQVFLYLPTECPVGFINDCRFDPTKKEVGFSKQGSPDNWAALEQLDALGCQFWNHIPQSDAMRGEYEPLLKGDWFILTVPNDWMVNITTTSDADKTKRSSLNLDVRIKGLYTRPRNVLKRFANGEPMFARAEVPLVAEGTKGKYPDEAFEMRNVSKWALSVEKYHGPVPQFFDDHSDQQSEEYTPVTL